MHIYKYRVRKCKFSKVGSLAILHSQYSTKLGFWRIFTSERDSHTCVRTYNNEFVSEISQKSSSVIYGLWEIAKEMTSEKSMCINNGLIEERSLMWWLRLVGSIKL
jgi:hypothetical protein